MVNLTMSCVKGCIILVKWQTTPIPAVRCLLHYVTVAEKKHIQVARIPTYMSQHLDWYLVL